MKETKMDLLQSYNAVNAILNTIDFNALFEGFHKGISKNPLYKFR